jgi:hypothetical protein
MTGQSGYRYFAIAALVLLATIPPFPSLGEVTGNAEANPRLVQLGTPFQVTITVNADRVREVRQPQFPELDGLTLTPNVGTEYGMDMRPGNTTIVSTFIAEYVGEKAGTYEIGPFNVEVVLNDGSVDQITVPAVTVEVHEDAPRPPSNIVLGRKSSLWKYLLMLALLAALAGLAYWYVKIQKKLPVAIAAPLQLTGVKTPEQAALEEIRALAIPSEDDARAVKEYYVKVDGILRTYLAKRHNVPTRDRTTWEMRREFFGRKRLGSRIEGVFELLNDCDWVKFAKSRPTIADIGAIPTRAADILTGTVVESREKEAAKSDSMKLS